MIIGITHQGKNKTNEDTNKKNNKNKSWNQRIQE